MPSQSSRQAAPEEDDYGFSTGATALPNGYHGNGNPQSNGFTSNSNGGFNPQATADSDKWYLHDSMRPVGAPVHGGNCKCYRCQRKLTAI